MQLVGEPIEISSGDAGVRYCQVLYRDMVATGYAIGTDANIWSQHVIGSNIGRLGPWRKLKPTLLQIGYLSVSLCINKKVHAAYVHELMLRSWIGLRPEGMECRHLNGRRIDNALSNLAYGTPEENQRDQYLHGTRVMGKAHKGPFLSEIDILAIRYRASDGQRHADISKIHKTTAPTVSRIARGVRGVEIGGPRTVRSKGSGRITTTSHPPHIGQ